MPDPTLSEAIQEAYASAPDDVVVLDTLELLHSAFATPIRVVRNHEDLTATLEATAPANPGAAVEFTGYAWAMTMPDVTDAAVPEVTITIDNVSREIVDNIEAALITQEKIECLYRAYLSTDLSGPHNDPPARFEIRHIVATVFQVVARASFGDLANRQFPNDDYTAVRFPGLVR